MTASYAVVKRGLEDTGFTLLLLFSGIISLVAISVLLFGQAGWMSPAVSAATVLRIYVLPWVAAFALLSIGREIWMIRVYFEHMHMGSEIQRFVSRSRQAR